MSVGGPDYRIYERLPYNKLRWVCDTDDLDTAKQYLKGFKNSDRQYAVVTREYYTKLGLQGVKGLPGPGPGGGSTPAEPRVKPSTRTIFQKKGPQ